MDELVISITLFPSLISPTDIPVVRRGLLVDRPPRLQAEVGGREGPGGRRRDLRLGGHGEIPGGLGGESWSTL